MQTALEMAAHTPPKTTPLLQPFDHPSAWTREQMEHSQAWQFTLSAVHVAELDHAVQTIRQQTIPQTHGAEPPLETILGSMTLADFPLPTLSARIAMLRLELENGRGFELWRGLPVARWSSDELSIAFWGLGLHLGRPVVQNARGELLGHVINTSGTDPTTNANSRFYHTNHAAPFHVDGADIVGLACVRTAKSGGASLVVSSCSIYNAILRDHPQLVPLLYQPLWFDHRGERNAVTGQPYWVTSICGWNGSKLSTMYLRNFIESGQRYPGAPQLTGQHAQLFDLIDGWASSDELCLSMDFRPGDIQWLNNHTTLHSRTRYEDWDDPERRRWLLRLWLNLDVRTRFTDTYGFYGIAAEGQAKNAGALS